MHKVTFNPDTTQYPTVLEVLYGQLCGNRNRKVYSVLSTAVRPIVHCNDCLDMWNQMSIGSFANGQSKMKVPFVGRNLGPNLQNIVG